MTLDQNLYLFNFKYSGMKCLFDEMEKVSFYLFATSSLNIEVEGFLT